MAYYLYNGIKLPALPESELLYAYISTNAKWSTKLYLSSVPLAHSSSYFLYSTADGNGAVWEINSDNPNQWSYVEDMTLASDTLLPTTQTYNDLIWANNDVYSYSNGTLYLAASEPVPVTEFKVKKFPLRQFILGLLSELTAGSAKEPIAYLYNGVRLPKLPEWDSGVYPYAFILYIGGLVQAYRLYLTPEITYKSAGDNWIIGHADNSCSYSAYDGDWKLYTEYPSGNDSLDSVENTIWANTDLLNEDGSVCLAKSEPVPVYE